MDIYTSLIEHLHKQHPKNAKDLTGHARNLQVVIDYILPKLIEDDITQNDALDPVVDTMRELVDLAHMNFHGGDPILMKAVRTIRRLLNTYTHRPIDNFTFEIEHQRMELFLMGYFIKPFSKRAYSKSKQLELDYLVNELDIVTGVIINRDFKAEASHLKTTFVSSYKKQRDRMLKTIYCLN